MAPRYSSSGKRLGRPPKNKTVETGSVLSSSATALVARFNDTSIVHKNIIISSAKLAKENSLISDDNTEIIECELLEMPEFMFLPDGPKKSGRYMNNPYSFKEFGRRKWVVGAYIKANWDDIASLKLNDTEVIKRCINHLNTFGRKHKKFGNLALFSKEIKYRVKYGQKVAIVEMTIEDRKNENFWGEGEIVRDVPQQD